HRAEKSLALLTMQHGASTNSRRGVEPPTIRPPRYGAHDSATTALRAAATRPLPILNLPEQPTLTRTARIPGTVTNMIEMAGSGPAAGVSIGVSAAAWPNSDGYAGSPENTGLWPHQDRVQQPGLGDQELFVLFGHHRDTEFGEKFDRGENVTVVLDIDFPAWMISALGREARRLGAPDSRSSGFARGTTGTLHRLRRIGRKRPRA